MKEEWKRQMQQKMADYEESDIDLSWGKIDKALEANRRKATGSHQKAKTIPMWFRRMAASVLILLLTGAGYWTLYHQAPKTTGPDAAFSDDVAFSDDDTYADDVNKPNHRERTLANAPTTPASENATVQPEHAETTETETRQTEAETTETGSTPSSRDDSQTQMTVRNPTPESLNLHKKNDNHSRLTAKVYFSNATGSYNSLLSSTQQINLENNTQPTDPPQNPPTPSHWPYEGETVSQAESNTGEQDNETNEDESSQQAGKTRQGNTEGYRTQHTSESTQHHQPVRFGLSLRYRLHERWSIESGLAYTLLTADFTKTVDDKSVNTEQRLNYIGIPFTVSYLLWESRYLNVYLSAGTLVEKMIKGSRTTGSETNSVSIHPLQLSLSGAAGAEFRFSPQVSLYAEPGIGYWFDNGSTIPTFYQEKPLCFSLCFGVRLSPW